MGILEHTHTHAYIYILCRWKDGWIAIFFLTTFDMAQSYEPWNAPGATTMCRVDRARLYGGTMPPAFPSRGRLKLNSLASRLHRWKIFGTKKPFRMEMMLRRNYLDINFLVFINELWRFLMDSGWMGQSRAVALFGPELWFETVDFSPFRSNAHFFSTWTLWSSF